MGCGEGKITAEISTCLANGSVLGIDNSKEMIEFARKTFPPDTYPHLSFQLLDFRDIDFVDAFDVVFSNAALHWVKDQLSVLKRISVSLRPNGHLILQQGGKGAREVFTGADQLKNEEPWKQYFKDFEFPFGFYGPEEYTAWLGLAGLQPVRVEFIDQIFEF